MLQSVGCWGIRVFALSSHMPCVVILVARSPLWQQTEGGKTPWEWVVKKNSWVTEAVVGCQIGSTFFVGRTVFATLAV